MAYSTEQILLIENLMYISNTGGLKSCESYEGQTVEEWLNDININNLDENANYGLGNTKDDYVNIINTAKNDPEILSLKIADTNIDRSEGGGGGFSATFINEDSKEAVVAFRGTAAGEWKDNFQGGGPTDQPDGVSTVQQENALEWYKKTYAENNLQDYDVTVTGHSKGANKAKYITIMDDTVDHCVSFDGQGFSDEFIDKYSDRIAIRQDIIENHNVDYDYVNPILNDVGNKTYYKGQNIGEAGFIENHCPDTFIKYDEHGNVIMEKVDGQPVEMQEIDKFMNSYLRSMNPEDKTKSLELIGLVADVIFTGKGITELKELLLNPTYKEEVAYLIAYLAEYEQANPEFQKAIDGILKTFNMNDAADTVEFVQKLLNHDNFDTIYNGFIKLYGFAVGMDWSKEKIKEFLKDKLGMDFSDEELNDFLDILKIVRNDMASITIDLNNGNDKVVSKTQDSLSGNGHTIIFYDLTQLKNISSNLESNSNSIGSLKNSVESIKKEIKGFTQGSYSQTLDNALYKILVKLENDKTKIKALSKSLDDIVRIVENTENKIISY